MTESVHSGAQGAAAGRARQAGRKASAAGRWARYEHVVLAVALGVGSLALWEFLSQKAIIEPVLFPPPTKVASAFWFLVRADFFPKHFWITMLEIAVGFLLGAAIGLLLGILLATVRLIRKTLYPYVIAFQALPKVVLAPLFIIWFGFGPASKIATALAICFFPVMLNTVVGLQMVEEDALKLMRSLRASKWQVFTKLRFPSALPHIFAGLKTSLTFAMIGAIVAEFLIAADNGLGRLVQIFQLQIQVHMMLAVVLIVSVLGIVGVWLMDILDRRVVFWRNN
ncbi:MAG: ABC transporter permease [Nitrospinota bacterium]